MADFDDSDEIFANPTKFGVTSNASLGHTQVDTGALENYNPFANINVSSDIPRNNVDNTSYPINQKQQFFTADLERRQRELDLKAAELDRREQEQRLQEEIQRSKLAPEKNWPPFHSKMPCKPWFYQDIELEIDPQFQTLVKQIYYLWIAYTIVLVINFVVTLSYLFVSLSDGASIFGVSIVALLCSPLSYLFWFRPVYKAFRKNSSFYFFVFFFVFLSQIIVLVIQSIGIFNTGCCGWIVGLKVVSSNKGVGVLCFMVALSLTAISILSVYLIYRVHGIFRVTGASFDKFKQELATNIVTNPTLKQTAAQAGMYAVSENFKNTNN